MEGWQDISTAPKDREVLLWVPDWHQYPGGTVKGARLVGRWVYGGHMDLTGWVVTDEQTGGPCTVSPTLWAELPPEPTE